LVNKLPWVERREERGERNLGERRGQERVEERRIGKER